MSPGARASTDQLVSAQPGLIPQISGRLTHQRVDEATVFVDHCSDHMYHVYLMRDLLLDETLVQSMAMNGFLPRMVFSQRHIMPVMANLQIRDFEMFAYKTTKSLHSMELEGIIKMALLSAKSKI
jgi:hypothetical protein